jgi:hypothetical protein
MIVWIASYPRSGNTMVRMLLSENFGLASRTCSIDDSGEFGQRKGGEKRGDQLLDGFRSEMGWGDGVRDAETFQQLRQSAELHLLKTHHYPPDDSPALYMLRDGRDALVSYTHYLKARWPRAATMTFDQVLEQLILGQLGFGDWSAHILAWQHRSATTAFVRYEDGLTRPFETLAAALTTLGMARPAMGTPPDFNEYRQRWPQFFRKGQTGAWREEMSPALQALFWKHHGATMQAWGYARQSGLAA